MRPGPMKSCARFRRLGQKSRNRTKMIARTTSPSPARTANRTNRAPQPIRAVPRLTYQPTPAHRPGLELARAAVRILASIRTIWVTRFPTTRAITAKRPIGTRTQRPLTTSHRGPSPSRPARKITAQNIPIQNIQAQNLQTQSHQAPARNLLAVHVMSHRMARRMAHRMTPPSLRGMDPARAGNWSRVAALIAFLGFALLGGTSARASSEEALTHFAQGEAAFEAEDFSRARALFEQALAAGMEGPAIHYNIGAAAYLGGDLPRAERAFREVARTPSMAALAHYNLGLVALRRRDEREAREWFEQTTQDVPDERLAALALERLAELPEARAPGFFSYYTRGGAGYDDNISLRSGSIESSATGDEDSYGELIFGGSYSFGDWRVDTAAAMLRYTHVDEFNQTAFSLGGARGFRLENWYFELGAYGSQFSLGGEVFEQNVGVGAQVSRAFYNGSRLSAQLRATSVDGKGDFLGLTGDR